jgi:hypothetical protein
MRGKVDLPAFLSPLVNFPFILRGKETLNGFVRFLEKILQNCVLFL